MKFVKNGWYAAAWAEEITRELFQRTLLNESVLLYRSEAGSVRCRRMLEAEANEKTDPKKINVSAQ